MQHAEHDRYMAWKGSGATRASAANPSLALPVQGPSRYAYVLRSTVAHTGSLLPLLPQSEQPELPEASAHQPCQEYCNNGAGPYSNKPFVEDNSPPLPFQASASPAESPIQAC